ncbi:MAG: helix-turn-helix transcriptional regulator [Gammaproteobacteria bacterium]|nr:helix-turn-helix transcriptional regulator [Gammaproteobacteria bacterium]
MFESFSANFAAAVISLPVTNARARITVTTVLIMFRYLVDDRTLPGEDICCKGARHAQGLESHHQKGLQFASHQIYRQTSRLYTKFPQIEYLMQIILDSQFSDLDLLMEGTRAWDLDLRLTQQGGFSGQIRQAMNRYVLITYARFGSRLHQSGSTPPGYRTFGLPAVDFRDFWWMGYDGDNRSLFKFGADRELAAVSGIDFAVYTISLRVDYIEKLSVALGVPFISTERGIVHITATQMADLRTLSRATAFHLSERFRAAAAHQLSVGLVSSLATGETLPRPSPRSRDRAIKRVVEFLHDTPDILPDLPALCEIAHVSERTLQYAFRERYGIPPKAFVTCWQLSLARRLLRNSVQEGSSIADIAAQCGFYDPSLFASHYRQLFGELPSATAPKVIL